MMQGLAMSEMGQHEKNAREARAARLNALRCRRYRRRKKRAQRVAHHVAATTGLITTYDALVDYLIARRKALGLTQLELDERAGFQSGYTAKLENWRGRQGRVAGSVTMPLWFQALGVMLKPITTAPGRHDGPPLNGAELARRIP